MTRHIPIAHLAGLLLCLVALTNASVTWRRVTKTTSAPIQYLTTEQVPSTTKSSITWRRSTVSRRSTPRQDDPPPPPFEEDEIEAADSREEASHVEDLENDSSFKPLVPGSRPGFWFDSSRRKKPSSLLRPGARRNSLFPTKSSTVATRTIENVTPVPFTPLTTTTPPTETPEINPSTPKSRLFGRNRSTKSPITLRKRLRTSKAPKIETTTEELESEELPLQIGELTPEPEKKVSYTEALEKEIDEFESLTTVEDSSAEPTKKKSSDSLKSGLGLRRRPKNGTRMSWRKASGRFNTTRFTTPLQTSNSRTTSTPSTSTQEYERISRKPTSISRLRSRVRANRTTSAPKVSWTRNQLTTISPTKSTDKKKVEKVKGPTDYLRNRNVHKFKRVKTTPITEAYEDEYNDIFTTTLEPTENYDMLLTSTKAYDFKSRTTVEPFYITRDYGQLVTAVVEEKHTRSRTRTRTTKSPKLSTTESGINEISDEVKPTEELKYIEPTDELQYIEPTEESQYDEPITTVKDVIETENTQLFNSLKTTTEDATTTTDPTTAIEETTEYQEPITTRPPHRYSSISSTPMTPHRTSYTIDPGTNAYVVWSMGQNGSGWSYENQGGQVKWSAQNSQAEGDRWSVQGKKESQADQGLWAPTRNTSSFLIGKQSERILSKPQDINKIHFTSNYKTNLDKNLGPVIYTPNIYRNETALKTKSKPESFDVAPFDRIVFQQSPPPPGIRDFTPPAYQVAANNYQAGVSKEPSLIQTFSLGTGPTQSSDNGTLMFDTNFDDPFVAEIRDTHNDEPNFEIFQSTNVSNTQEYITEAPETSQEIFASTTTVPQMEVNYGSYFGDYSPKVSSSPYNPSNVPSFDRGYPDHIGETPVPNFYSSQGAHQGVRDLSGIPPALVKAVVDAKRWTVVGNGGEDGWSLLGENGQLEWKINNIDGKWSVTSADQVMKMPIQVPAHYETVPNGEEGTEIIEKDRSEEVKLTPSKVWRLEDDYEKWKALSAEGGVTEAETPKGKWISNGEYEYDQSEEDYYEDEDEYDDADEGYNTYPAAENYEDRPLWGTGENQMVVNYNGDKPGHKYSTYGGHIESANTKEDAISAWKSLLAGQLNWNPSENKKIPSKTSQSTPSYKYPPTKSSTNHNRNVEPSATPNSRQEYKDLERARTTPLENLERTQETNLYENGNRERHQPSNEPNTRNVVEFGQNRRTYGNENKVRYQPSDELSTRNVLELGQNKRIHEHKNRDRYQPSDESNAGNVVELGQNRKTYEHENRKRYKPSNDPSTGSVEEFGQSERKEFGSVQNVKASDKKDHEKVHTLINKLENIQKEAKGRTVVDLSQLLKLIKAKTNSSSISSKQNNDQISRNETQNNDNHFIRNKDKYEERPQIPKQIDPTLQKYGPEVYQGLIKHVDFKHQRLAKPEEYAVYSEQTNSHLQDNVKPDGYQGFSKQLDSNLQRHDELRKYNEFSKQRDTEFQRDGGPKEYDEYSKQSDLTLQNYDKTDDEYSSGFHKDQQRDRTEGSTRDHKKSNGNRYFTEGKDPISNTRFISDPRHPTHNKQQNPSSDQSTEYRASPDTDIEQKETYFRGTKLSENVKFVDSFPSNTRYNHYEAQDENTSNRRKSEVKIEDKRIFKEEKEYHEDYRHVKHSPYRTYNKHKDLTDEVSAANSRLSDKGIQENDYSKDTRRPEGHQSIADSPHYQNPVENILDRKNAADNDRNRKFDETEQNEGYRVRNRQRYSKSKPRRKQNNKKGQQRQPVPSGMDPNPFSVRNDEQSREIQEKEEPSTRYSNPSKSRNTRRRKPSENRHRRPQDGRHKAVPSNRPQQYKSSNTVRTPETNVDYSDELVLDVRDRYQAPDSHEPRRRFNEEGYSSQLKSIPVKQKRPENKRPHRPHHPPPIVLSSETEIEDNEGGSKKSRKIIVIDYAGKQKKKSPIDRKDLELIIRNVKNRRSEMFEEISGKNSDAV